MQPSRPPRLVIVAVASGVCDQCGKTYTQGVEVMDGAANRAASFCMWCTLMALDDVTGRSLTQQVVSWYAQKRYWRRVKELGWSGRRKT